MSIVLEEMRKQLESSKRDAVEQEKLHKEEIRALKDKLADYELVIGGGKKKED